MNKTAVLVAAIVAVLSVSLALIFTGNATDGTLFAFVGGAGVLILAGVMSL